MVTAKQIANLLKKQPLEDVYSKNFAGKKTDREALALKRDLFTEYYSEFDDFNKRKLRYFINWVETKIINQHLKKFPSYLELYLDEMYSPNGLKMYTKRYVSEVILSKELESYVDRNEIVKEFEQKLINKNWWTTSDAEMWEGFQKKRSKVELFEEYIYALDKDLRKTMNDDIEKYPDNYPKVYNKHINNIRLQMSELKLFEGDSLKIIALGKLIEYFTELCNIESKYFGPGYDMKFFSKSNNELKYLGSISKEEEYQDKVEQKLKLNLLHQFGIIKHLKEVWLEKKIKRPLTYLITTLISEPYDSVQPRLTKPKDPVLRNKRSVPILKNYLKQFGIELDEIIHPKK
ncbi:MAG: hypothetical protein IPL31_00250 [Saprospiraceae bacterium]|nr:hypothetical protein [Saprospiraceae bacterium]